MCDTNNWNAALKNVTLIVWLPQNLLFLRPLLCFFSIHPILLLYKIQILLSKSCPCGNWREAQGHRLITTRDRQLYNCGVVRCVSTSVIFICPCAQIPSKTDICVQSSILMMQPQRSCHWLYWNVERDPPSHVILEFLWHSLIVVYLQ